MTLLDPPGVGLWSQAEAPPAGHVGPGELAGASASPLKLDKNTTEIGLVWTAGCSAAATDYAIYSGAPASWIERTVETCSTAAQLSWTLANAGGSRFYLVVPRDATIEGGYGADSTGSPRSPAAAPCLSESRPGC